MVWKDLIEKNMKKKIRKRPATREGLKGKESPEVLERRKKIWPSPRGHSGTETDWVADRQRMEDEIISKEEIIKELSRQTRTLTANRHRDGKEGTWASVTDSPVAWAMTLRSEGAGNFNRVCKMCRG